VYTLSLEPFCFYIINFLSYSSTLNIEAVYSCETSLNYRIQSVTVQYFQLKTKFWATICVTRNSSFLRDNLNSSTRTLIPRANELRYSVDKFAQKTNSPWWCPCDHTVGSFPILGAFVLSICMLIQLDTIKYSASKKLTIQRTPFRERCIAITVWNYVREALLWNLDIDTGCPIKGPNFLSYEFNIHPAPNLRMRKTEFFLINTRKFGTDTGWRARVRFPAEQDFFFCTASRPILGPNQSPVQCAPGDLYRWLHRPGLATDLPPPFGVEVKNVAALPPLSQAFCWIH
jgi:hypothetical protein